MPDDNRLYARLCLDFADHAKIAILSDAAFRCLIEMILWSRQHMTDGLVPTPYALKRWSKEALDELANNDPQQPSIKQNQATCLIHDFSKHQTTTKDLLTVREKRIAAGRKGGIASAASKRQANVKQNQARDRDRVLSYESTHSPASSSNGDSGNDHQASAPTRRALAIDENPPLDIRDNSQQYRDAAARGKALIEDELAKARRGMP